MIKMMSCFIEMTSLFCLEAESQAYTDRKEPVVLHIDFISQRVTGKYSEGHLIFFQRVDPVTDDRIKAKVPEFKLFVEEKCTAQSKLKILFLPAIIACDM